MRPRSLGRLISIMSTLRARLSVPVSTKRKTHPIHDPPAGNLPDRSYGSRRHPPNLWALPYPTEFDGLVHRRGDPSLESRAPHDPRWSTLVLRARHPHGPDAPGRVPPGVPADRGP